MGRSLACDTPGNWGSSTEEAHCVCNVCIVGSILFRMFIRMPPPNRLFCQRCDTSTPFEGISTKRRHLQNSRCASCGSAIHSGESKWLTNSGQSRVSRISLTSCTSSASPAVYKIILLRFLMPLLGWLGHVRSALLSWHPMSNSAMSAIDAAAIGGTHQSTHHSTYR